MDDRIETTPAKLPYELEQSNSSSDVSVLDDVKYGRRDMYVYPITHWELDSLRISAVAACFLVGIPFLIMEVFALVRRLNRETQFNVHVEKTEI